jgi:hypothetical protein
MSKNHIAIAIVEMRSASHPYGDPDQGVPEEALRDFIATHPVAEEDSVCKGEHEFIIWRGEDTFGEYGTFFANAWTLPNANAEREYTTYYEFKTTVYIEPDCDTPMLAASQDELSKLLEGTKC